MKHIRMKSILLAAFICASAANAALYKGMNEEGSMAYSDKPFDNAEEISPPEITVVDALKIPPKKELVENKKTVETSYSSFSISAPADGETIWNVPDLSVSLKLKPALDIAQGHTVRILMDGKPVLEKSQNLVLHVGRADRGEHTLSAQIVNKKGKVLSQAGSITVYIKKTSIRKNPL